MSKHHPLLIETRAGIIEWTTFSRKLIRRYHNVMTRALDDPQKKDLDPDPNL